MRIQALNNQDPDLTPDATQAQRNTLLGKRRRQLEVFISQVASCVSLNHYNTVVRHATSLEWVFLRIREDYGISQKGINFMNLRLIRYDPATMTPSSFYHMYRTHLINHTARNGETIEWKNNLVMNQDEQLGPSYEDFILYSAIEHIDPRLIDYIHRH